MLPPDVTLLPAAEPDFPMLRELATTIWRQHYAGIISAAQIAHMLAVRFSDGALRAQARAPGRWIEMLRVSGLPVGYCGCDVADGDGVEAAAALKLGQLYVLQSHRGMGLGKFMLGRIEDRARLLGRGVLFLQVNKRNTQAIGFYESQGFRIAREAVVDIGSGFVMDDYVMEKRL